jgi:hypothetical protein
MKKTKLMILITATTLTLFGGGCGLSENGGLDFGTDPDDKIYSEYADKICMCFNESSKPLPQELKQIVIDSKGDPETFDLLLEEYASTLGIMGGIGDMLSIKILKNNLDICFKGIQTGMDESDFKTQLSEQERNEKIMEKMYEKGDCEFGYYFVKLDMAIKENP